MKWISNFFKKKQSFDIIADTPEERVNAFISNWYAQWEIAQKKMGEDVNFDTWGKLIAPVDDIHFQEGSSSGSRNSFSSKPSYHPRYEKIKECDLQGDTAEVYTEMYDSVSKKYDYHVFDLHRCQNGNWLISEIYTLFHPPKAEVIDPSIHQNIRELSSFDCPFVPSEENLNLNENTLFQGGRSVVIPNLGESDVTLNVIGKLNVRSGVIGILDFGYDIYDFEPLARQVSPGEYAVETITVFDRIAGVRILFSETER